MLIKKAFKDDPLFLNSKVIYSLYNDDFSIPLNKTFKNKILMDGISKKDVTVLEQPDFINVSKLAVQYSDGIILANPNVNSAITEFITASGKACLSYHGTDDYIDEYAQFYETILAKKDN
jgi:starch synthase